jgi:hypothetical protein
MFACHSCVDMYQLPTDACIRGVTTHHGSVAIRFGIRFNPRRESRRIANRSCDR